MVWAAVAIGGASLIAGYRASDEQADAQSAALQRADDAVLRDAILSGSGGARGYSTSQGDIGYSVGNLVPAQQRFADVADFAGRQSVAALSGVPSNVLSASRALDEQPLDMGAFVRGGAGADALAGLSLRQAFDPARTSERVTESALRTLRAQARPEEERAQRSFIQNLYSTGRGAVTGAEGDEASLGGGRLAAAFAQGLGRADLERQLQAQSYGARAAELEESLLTGAFERFRGTAGLAADFNTAAYGRRRQALQDRLRRETALSTLPADIASAFQQVATQGTAGAINVGDFGVRQAELALRQNTARSNAQAGVASTFGAITSSPNYVAAPGLDAFSALTSGATDAAVAGLGQRFPNAPIVGTPKTSSQSAWDEYLGLIG